MAKISVESLSTNLVIDQEQENQFQTLIHQLIKMLPAAVAMFDIDMRYLAVSDQWYTETKVSKRKDIIGQLHYDVIQDIPLKWKILHQRCLKGEHLKCDEDVFRCKDGHKEWLKWEIAPWYINNKIGGMFMFIEHLTDRKNTENKMKEMIGELKRCNSALKRFAHICAHDMREPIRTIYSYIELIEEKVEKKGEALEYTKYIKASAIYLNNLIKDLLFDAEMDGASLNFKHLSLEEIITNIMTVLYKEIEEKKIVVSYDKLPVIYGDEVLLNQLIQNLISNSIKYNKTKNPVIHIRARELKNAWIVSLEDNGIGIEPQYFKTIFEPFERLHNKAEYEGSGLGLSQCKKIIESHKGKIWVRSELTKGATFYFMIPKEQ